MDTAPAVRRAIGDQTLIRAEPSGCQQVEYLCKTGTRNPIETRLKQPAAIL